MCKWAYKQATVNVAGYAYACFLPCKGNLDFRRELTWFATTTSCQKMYASCDTLQSEMRRRRYHVIGMAETFLSEVGGPVPQPLCAKKKGCCICNSPALRDRPYSCTTPRTTVTRALQVERGARSPLASNYPLEWWRPMTTFCPNIAYTFFMHDPIRRIVSMLAMKCATCENATRVADCAEHMLDDIEKRDLLVDVDDGTYMMGTAAVNNYNIRMLLGPRTFFAGLNLISEPHLHGAQNMLKRFAIVSPLQNISNIGPLLHRELNWTALTATVSNAHHSQSRSRDAVYARVATRLRSLNAYDLRLYEFVKAEFYKRFTRTMKTRPFEPR